MKEQLETVFSMRSVLRLCYIWREPSRPDRLARQLHRPQNRVHSTIGNLDRLTPVREVHVAPQIPYVFDYVVMQNRGIRNPKRRKTESPCYWTRRNRVSEVQDA
jgi:hypothetical protein